MINHNIMQIIHRKGMTLYPHPISRIMRSFIDDCVKTIISHNDKICTFIDLSVDDISDKYNMEDKLIRYFLFIIVDFNRDILHGTLDNIIAILKDFFANNDKN